MPVVELTRVGRSRRLLPAAIVAVALAVGCSSSAHSNGERATTSSPGPISSVPKDKQAALDAAVPFVGPLPGGSDTTPRLNGFKDKGAPNQIAAIEAAVPTLLTADRATFRLPVSESDIDSRLDAPLRVTWASASRQIQYTEKRAALEALVRNDPGPTYTDNRFVVDAWSGVSTDGKNAFALLDGHDTFLDSRSHRWEPDEKAQWQIKLANEDGWKLLEVRSFKNSSG